MLHYNSIFKLFVKTVDILPSAPWVTESYASSGTGFCIEHKNKKYLLTNYHVVENAVIVKTGNFDCQILALDMFTDLALLYCPELDQDKNVIALQFGTAKTGDYINIQGYPLQERGLNYVEGTISKLTKIFNLRDKRLMFMSDCLTDHGNSGSPVFMNDKVIGVLNSGIGQAVNYSVIIPFFAAQDFIHKATEKNENLHVHQRYCNFTWQMISENMKEFHKLKNTKGFMFNDEVWTHIQGAPILEEAQIKYSDFLAILGYDKTDAQELISFHYLFNFLDPKIIINNGTHKLEIETQYYVPDMKLDYKIFGDTVFVRGYLGLAERVVTYVPQNHPFVVFSDNSPKFQNKIINMQWPEFCEKLQKAKEDQVMPLPLLNDNWIFYVKKNAKAEKKLSKLFFANCASN